MLKNSYLFNGEQLPTVALLIPSLEVGGAERQLLDLGKAIHSSKWNVLILSMYDKRGAALDNRTESVVPAYLGKTNPVSFLVCLGKVLRRKKVAILHAYLLTAQMYAVLCRLLFWRGRLVLGVRDSMRVFHHKSLKDIFCNLVVYGFSFVVDKYIFNSAAGMEAKKGYISKTKMKLIFNGIDTNKFRPSADSRNFLRACLGIPGDVLIVGIVANVSVYKDYPNFIAAAKIVADQFDLVRFVAIGEVSGRLGKTVKDMVRERFVSDRFYFMGCRSGVDRLIPGMDVFCSSSETEGFSNAICEAMACGVPCVVTDVGDSRFIVGETGIVVPPSEPEKLAREILYVLRSSDEKRVAMGQAGRMRIVNEFSIARMVREHEAVYESLMKNW